MERIPLDRIFEKKNLILLKTIIREDGILAYPTDTLYGLGGNFLSPRVVDQIDRLKERDNLPYSAAVSDLLMAERLIEEIPVFLKTILAKLFPGPFTALLPAGRSIPVSVLRGLDKIGIRIPAVPEILKLIRTIDTPIISTSVNRSGFLPLNNPDDIAADFPELDLLIDGGVLAPSLGSTILDFCESPVQVVRRGDGLDRLPVLGIECPSD